MNSQSRRDATSKCEQFTRQELNDYKEANIWSSCYPVMERLLSRSVEMGPVYEEICNKLDGYSTNSASFILTMEAIWISYKFFNTEAISRKKDAMKELVQLHKNIPILVNDLCEAINRQSELLEQEDFDPGLSLGSPELLALASHSKASYIEEGINELHCKYDRKYWPTVAEIIAVIGAFEASRPIPTQNHLPSDVMGGRATILKDFVLSFDADLKNTDEIPNSFSFSNSSMATIVNIALDLPVDQIATSDAIRLIRKRRNDGVYSKDSLTVF